MFDSWGVQNIGFFTGLDLNSVLFCFLFVFCFVLCSVALGVVLVILAVAFFLVVSVVALPLLLLLLGKPPPGPPKPPAGPPKAPPGPTYGLLTYRLWSPDLGGRRRGSAQRYNTMLIGLHRCQRLLAAPATSQALELQMQQGST